MSKNRPMFGKMSGILILTLSILFSRCGTESPGDSPDHSKKEGQLEWLRFEEGFKIAKERDKLVLIDFYTDWCMPCIVMDSTTHKDREVISLINREFVPVKVDCEEQDSKRKGEPGLRIARKYSVYQYPTYIVLDKDGKILWRFNGSVPAHHFTDQLKKALKLRK